MMDATAPRHRRWAKIGITLQFLALVRTVAEYHRLRHVHGGALPLATIDFYLTGILIAALFCWLAVTLYFFERHRAAVATSALMIAVLIVYKLVGVP
jgi:hypothetical protein